MNGAAPSVLVLCLGNTDRGDDGAGLAVADALAGRLPPGAMLVTCSGDLLSQIDLWCGCGALVCVDAAEATGEPGRIRRVDLAAQDLPRDVAFVSSHAFGLGETIALARTLDLVPQEIVVFAIEGTGFDVGAGMTAQVAAAVAPLADRILAEVVTLLKATGHA